IRGGDHRDARGGHRGAGGAVREGDGPRVSEGAERGLQLFLLPLHGRAAARRADRRHRLRAPPRRSRRSEPAHPVASRGHGVLRAALEPGAGRRAQAQEGAAQESQAAPRCAGMKSDRWTAPKVRGLKGKERIAVITAYDYPTAVVADRAGVEVILVGDSLGMVVLGYESTLP